MHQQKCFAQMKNKPLLDFGPQTNHRIPTFKDFPSQLSVLYCPNSRTEVTFQIHENQNILSWHKVRHGSISISCVVYKFDSNVGKKTLANVLNIISYNGCFWSTTVH